MNYFNKFSENIMINLILPFFWTDEIIRFGFLSKRCYFFAKKYLNKDDVEEIK
jgi:hypothetical protein